MEKWMYGLGKDPDASAALLKELGFTTIAGGVSCVEPALRQGMDIWLFSGCYRGPAFKGEEWLAQDVAGETREWFGSTCPTREEVRQYHLESVARLARTPGIRGIILDGCRFASPSSGSTEDAFLTCFCDSCMRKAKKMGFDPDAMKRSVSALYEGIHGKSVDILPYAPGLEEWLQFRRAATTEHLLEFCRVVHREGETLGRDLKAGIFIFAPSLARMVGQSYEDLKGNMDMYSPMLYRCYQDPNGPACLNVEMADLLRMLQKASCLSAGQRKDLLRIFSELDPEEEFPKEEFISRGKITPEMIFRGFRPEILQKETASARRRIGKTLLAPIIQLDDPVLYDATLETFKGGADAVSYFLYKDEWMEEKQQDFQRLQRITG
ncbi:MAG: hypothetical protein HUJ69_00620 [Lachnospiraceae bacterium]|nr:hypothetical protein [Lachnospiraceae bacterium]